jgi:hypothetical protein
MDEAHQALLDELRRRLRETRDDPDVKNAGGSNYWGPYVTRAVEKREHDGPGLVRYVKDMLRKSGDSEGWNALLEAGRLDLSFEDMVVHAAEPIRSLFSDEDREVAERSLRTQQGQLDARHDTAEAIEVERDRKIAGMVGEKRLAGGKPWTDEMEAQLLAERAARRRPGG